MSRPQTASIAMAWLDKRGAGDRARGAVEHFRATSGLPDDPDVNALMQDMLVATAVLVELMTQLSKGERADAEGLTLARAFMRAHPTILPNLQASGRNIQDPNQREMMHTLLARAQSEYHTQPKRQK